MDRRTMLAVVLSLAIWYGWLTIRAAIYPPEPAAIVEGTSPPTPAPVVPAPVVPVPVVPVPVQDVASRDLPFEACGGVGTLSTDGGRVRDVTLPNHFAPYHMTPLYTWVIGWVTGSSSWPFNPYGQDPGPAVVLSPRSTSLATGFGAGDQALPLEVVSSAPTAVELAGRSAEGIEIRKRIAERREGEVCQVEVDVTWTNSAPIRYEGDLWLSLHDHTPAGGSQYTSQRQPMALVDGGITYGGRLGDGCVSTDTNLTDERRVIPLPGPVSWVGLSDRYFGFYVVPEHPDQATLALTRIGLGDEALDGGRLAFAGGLEAGGSRTERFKVYVGPNHTDALALVDPSLTRAVDLGWSKFFGTPLLWLLREFHGLVGNWGIAIILLTFLVKAAFFPLTQRSFKSMQRMQQIQPELAKIKEQYADNPQEMNRRTLELMKVHQVNPLSGCLPTLVQMPVWIALYQVLLSSVDLYHTEFLYLQDLTEPDPYCVLPIVITVLMWFQQQMSTPTNLDPVQQQVMRYMPLVFGFMFFGFPSGLAVYVFVNMVLSILQQWWIKRSLGSGGAPAVAPAS